MTLQKKLKKAVRARSRKTGESYTTARRQLLALRQKAATHKRVEPPVAEPAAVVAPPARPLAATPSLTKGAVTDEAARKKTGFGLEHWFAVLDAFDAPAKGHTATAAHLYRDHGVSSWYSQGITVAYERARGLRDVHQSCTGSFQVSVSKTVPATVAEVVDAIKNTKRRAAWLADADPEIVQALKAAFTGGPGGPGGKPREVKTKGSDYAWLRFPQAGATVVIYINGKPNGRTTIVADSSNLPAAELVEIRRAQWRKALDGLHRHLAG